MLDFGALEGDLGECGDGLGEMEGSGGFNREGIWGVFERFGLGGENRGRRLRICCRKEGS